MAKTPPLPGNTLTTGLEAPKPNPKPQGVVPASLGVSPAFSLGSASQVASATYPPIGGGGGGGGSAADPTASPYAGHVGGGAGPFVAGGSAAGGAASPASLISPAALAYYQSEEWMTIRVEHYSGVPTASHHAGGAGSLVGSGGGSAGGAAAAASAAPTLPQSFVALSRLLVSQCPDGASDQEVEAYFISIQSDALSMQRGIPTLLAQIRQGNHLHPADVDTLTNAVTINVAEKVNCPDYANFASNEIAQVQAIIRGGALLVLAECVKAGGDLTPETFAALDAALTDPANTTTFPYNHQDTTPIAQAVRVLAVAAGKGQVIPGPTLANAAATGVTAESLLLSRAASANQQLPPESISNLGAALQIPAVTQDPNNVAMICAALARQAGQLGDALDDGAKVELRRIATTDGVYPVEVRRCATAALIGQIPPADLAAIGQTLTGGGGFVPLPHTEVKYGLAPIIAKVGRGGTLTSQEFSHLQGRLEWLVGLLNNGTGPNARVLAVGGDGQVRRETLALLPGAATGTLSDMVEITVSAVLAQSRHPDNTSKLTDECVLALGAIARNPLLSMEGARAPALVALMGLVPLTSTATARGLVQSVLTAEFRAQFELTTQPGAADLLLAQVTRGV